MVDKEKFIYLVLRNQVSRKIKKKYVIFQKCLFIRLNLWTRSILINWELCFKMSMADMTFLFLNWPWNAWVSPCLMTDHIKQPQSRKRINFEGLYAHHLCSWLGRLEREYYQGCSGAVFPGQCCISWELLGGKVQLAYR